MNAAQENWMVAVFMQKKTRQEEFKGNKKKRLGNDNDENTWLNSLQQLDSRPGISHCGFNKQPISPLDTSAQVL